MPGTTGFGMAVFKLSEFPLGTKLYTHAQPAQVPSADAELVAAALPIVRTYAAMNPPFEWNGSVQDPNGAHAWLEKHAAQAVDAEGKQP